MARPGVDARAQRTQCADLPMPAVTGVVLRATSPLPTLVTAQFFNVHASGATTAAGILSMPADEWDSPAWRRIRAAVDTIEDLRSHADDGLP